MELIWKDFSFKPLPRAAGQSVLPASRREAFERALESCPNTHIRGYMLLCGGKVIAERFWTPYAPQDKVWVYSLSKSFASTAVGLAVAEGLLSVEDRVIDFFPEKAPANPCAHLRDMRVRHLLSMNTGHAAEPLPGPAELFSSDWVEYVLHYPLKYAPGSHFLYNSAATFVLSAIVQKVSGSCLVDFLHPRLFVPLGFDETLWASNPQGINMGAVGLMTRLEDIAKLGQLYLNQGVYNGKRILPEEWVRAATSVQSDTCRPGEPTDWSQGYGYQFWRCRHGAYRGDGAYGQYCVVMPQHDMVLVLLSETSEMQGPLEEVWRYLLPGGPAAETEREIQGKAYCLKTDESSPLGVTSLRFDFEKEALRLTLADAESSTVLLCGRGGWAEGEADPRTGGGQLWCLSSFPLFSLQGRAVKTAARFVWQNEKTLRVSWAYRETPHRADVEFVFGDKGLTLRRLPGILDKKPAEAVFVAAADKC